MGQLSKCPTSYKLKYLPSLSIMVIRPSTGLSEILVSRSGVLSRVKLNSSGSSTKSSTIITLMQCLV